MYSFWELFTFFIVYSFAGWLIEVGIVAIKERRFRNRGFVNLPFCTMYGVMMCLLIVLWPHMVEHPFYKLVVAFAIFVVVQSFAEFLTNRICHRMVLKYEDITPYNGQWMNLLVAILFAIGLWMVTELVHPFVYFVVDWMPELVLKICCVVLGTGIFLDFMITLYIMVKNRGNQKVNAFQQREQEKQSNLNGRIYKKIWTS